MWKRQAWEFWGIVTGFVGSWRTWRNTDYDTLSYIYAILISSQLVNRGIYIVGQHTRLQHQRGFLGICLITSRLGRDGGDY